MSEAVTTVPDNQPLAGVRVLDLSDGKSELCGRYLADLGADVVLIEAPSGAGARSIRRGDRDDLYFASHNANKRSVIADLSTEAGRATLLDLIIAADILIETTRPGTLPALGLGPDVMFRTNPRLVLLSITDYGQTGPYRDFVATNDTHIALAGVLCRSGLPGEPPLLPPGELAYEATAVQAAWCALLGYLNALQTGRGDHLDFSIYEATAQIIDPGLGTTGSAAAGASALTLPRGRPDARHLYPIFKCADGYVRICVLSPRQWSGMLSWLGEPEELRDPELVSTLGRFAQWGRVQGYVERLFRDQPAAGLVAEGQRLGVPIARLLSPSEVLKTEHFQARGAFGDVMLADGTAATLPSGFVEINESRAGYRNPAPVLGAGSVDVIREWSDVSPLAVLVSEAAGESMAERTAPLAGLRVLDLGVIVAGAEAGRLFADQGADVIKIESNEFPDGARTAMGGFAISPSFSAGARGKRGFGVNLRTPEGHALFLQLVARSDVVLTNFRPGTMESLGLDYNTMRAANPGIVFVESSALGRTGPWARSLGYGPLVRASSSFTSLWRYPEVEDSFSDGVTIVPDHLAARVAGVAVLSLIVQRLRTGIGGTVAVAQAEVIFNVMAEHFLRESIEPGSFGPRTSADSVDAPSGVYPCAGDDEWCVIEVRGDRDFAALMTAIGDEGLAGDPRFATRGGRRTGRGVLDKAVTAWTERLSPTEVMTILQAAGVPATKMQRLTEYENDPHFRARAFIRELHQPQLPEPLATENGPCLSMHMSYPELRPAPLMGEHTRQIAGELLGLNAQEIEELIELNVLQVAQIPTGPS